MKFFTRLWFVIVWAATVQVIFAAKPGEPGGPGEYRDFKVLKSYSASEGEYLFRAFVIEWEEQEVVANDAGALIKAGSDDTINVLVSRAVPPAGQSAGRIVFLARPEKKPPLEESALRGRSAEIGATNPPEIVQLRVNKVYALQGGVHTFRAYEVNWKGQQVIVDDPLVRTTYEVGDTLTVMVSKHPYPDGSKPHGLLSFHMMPARAVNRTGLR